MYTEAGALISSCETYRYRLWREWRLGNKLARWQMWTDEKGNHILDGAGKQVGEPERIVFVMLNPSTADGEQDDQTILKCVKFAKRFGYDRMEVVNLFAYRATKPEHLLRLTHNDDPVGPDNRDHVIRAISDDLTTAVICAWGMHGKHLGQDETTLGWIGPKKMHALGFTMDGSPRHPLYLKDTSPLLPYNPPVRHG